MRTWNARRALLLTASALAVLPRLVNAQDALEWVVPYPAGGGSDIAARLVSDLIAKSLKQTIVINNKPGGATTIAAQYVVTHKGSVLLSADFAMLAANPSLFAKLPYSPESDFAFIGMLARAPMVLVVAPQVPASNLAELVAWVKSKPDGANFASAGVGSPHHLVGEQVKDLLGLKLSHVAYRGATPALSDLVGGHVQLAMMDLGSASSFVSGGKIKVLAVATQKRIAQFPDVPTFDESGYKGYEAYAWQSLVASNGTTAEMRERLNVALNAALTSPEVKERMQALGIEPMPTSPQQASAYASAERTRWGAVIRKNNIRVD